MLVEDFSIETADVGGYPVQTFKKRFRNIWEMFSKCTAFYDHEIYLVEGQDRLTFRQTADIVAGMAARLEEKAGVRKGDHVGILMENSIRFIISFWATQKLGATAVVFNTRLTTPELKRQLQFSDLKVLLSSPLLSARTQEVPSGSFDFRQIVLGEDWPTDLPTGLQTDGPDRFSEDDTALILFTSGTVGTPKRGDDYSSEHHYQCF